MKKLIILFILLLTVPGYAQDLARLNTPIIGTSVAGAAAGNWYYSGDGNYQSSGGTSASFDYGVVITVSAGTSIKKIAVQVYSDTGSSTFKMALYNSDGSTRLATCSEYSNPVGTGWIECTLGTPVSITSPVNVQVWHHQSGSDGLVFYRDTDNATYYQGGTYADFPPLSVAEPSTAANQCSAARVYVE